MCHKLNLLFFWYFAIAIIINNNCITKKIKAVFYMYGQQAVDLQTRIQ